MLCQCIHSNQKDWVSKLPEIEFAINSAWSESTGYAPFFLNFSRMPQMMLWSSAPSDKYPAVWDFALEKKLALMSAHDSILSAQIKQTHNANKKQQTTPFKKGDLVYLSSKNILFVKGLACKLVPKFVRPYLILREYGNALFQLNLPIHLKWQGIHNVFHSSLPCIHSPNDDWLFPGWMDTQLGETSRPTMNGLETKSSHMQGQVLTLFSR